MQTTVGVTAATRNMSVVATRVGSRVGGGSSRRMVTKAMNVRPYTVRKGDTLFTISQKRDVQIEDILSVNHALRKNQIDEGQTILIPSSKLSERDREILEGVKTKGHRAYPVRKGETIEDIAEKRGIKMEDLETLNEGVDLQKLKAYQVIKLPRNKFTTREKEMLTGCARVPAAFFSAASDLSFGKIALVMLVAGVAGVAAWKSRED
jgi:LysM repeat protein